MHTLWQALCCSVVYDLLCGKTDMSCRSDSKQDAPILLQQPSQHFVLTSQQRPALLAKPHAAQALVGKLAIRLSRLGPGPVGGYGSCRGGALQQG